MISEHFSKLPEVKQNLPENCRRQFEKKFDGFLKQIDPAHKDWKLLKEDGTFKMYSKKDDDFVTLRSEYVLPFPLATCYDRFNDAGIRLKYDTLMEKVEILKKVNDNFSIAKAQIKGKFLIVSPRDFVTYKVHGHLDEKVILDSNSAACLRPAFHA